MLPCALKTKTKKRGKSKEYLQGYAKIMNSVVVQQTGVFADAFSEL